VEAFPFLILCLVTVGELPQENADRLTAAALALGDDLAWREAAVAKLIRDGIAGTIRPDTAYCRRARPHQSRLSAAVTGTRLAEARRRIEHAVAGAV